MFLVDKRTDIDGEWISSADIFLSIFEITRSQQKAKKLLNKVIANEQWPSRAAAGICQLDFGSIPTLLPRPPDARTLIVSPLLIDIYQSPNRHVRILPNFWESKRSLFVEELWDWRSGVFASVGFLPTGLVQLEGDKRWLVEVPNRWVAFDVEFSAQPVLNFISKISGRIDNQRSEKRIKARNKNWPYATVLLELESEIENGSISRFGGPHDYGVQAQIGRFIRDRILEAVGDEPPKSSVSEKARTVMKQWRHHASGGR